MEELKVSLVQTNTYWENPVANLADLEEKIMAMEQSTDLIVLPETFSTGFSARASELSEPMNFHTHKWMKQIAAQTQAAICGSLLIQENGKVYNRFLFVEPKGKTHHYDKRHRFSLGGEGDQIEAGKENITIEYKGWRIRPQICYDLRFPVWSRNKELEYDILIYSANWPAKRQHVWDILLAARAVENQAYVFGSNRVGEDGAGIQYNGGSTLIDFKGRPIAIADNTAQTLQTKISLNRLKDFRAKFPVWKDADRFSVE
ncbi:amidohydrolase [Marinilongibacter aquaticus]|uniref:amidohydrolase n=1 Tax=Marinilongibacter aquaticus TaxID=2975157 RepID=UPI0021BD79BA|nr:amidohydrolase [Marinilongibacter aquaticus]UBM57623.1 amidohydrolase [Marinilongibacter aquaticus]